MKQPRNNAAEQRGFILVTSLIFLVVLTLLAVVAINSSTLNQRMAGNQQEKARALLVANAGLTRAEQLMKDRDFVSCATLFTVPDPQQQCGSEAGQLGKKLNYGTFSPSQNPDQDQSRGWQAVYKTDFLSDSFWNAGDIEHYDLPSGSGAHGASVAYRVDYLAFVSRPSTISQPDAAYFFLITAKAEGLSSNASAVVQSIFEIDR